MAYWMSSLVNVNPIYSTTYTNHVARLVRALPANRGSRPAAGGAPQLASRHRKITRIHPGPAKSARASMGHGRPTPDFDLLWARDFGTVRPTRTGPPGRRLKM